MLRALSLVDVLAQLNQDSQTDVPFDPSEVINQFVADEETLNVGSGSLTIATLVDYPVNIIQDVGPVAYWRLDDPLGSSSAYDSSPWASATYPKVPLTLTGTLTWQAMGAMPGSRGVLFPGTSNNYLSVASTTSLQIIGDLTVELWLSAASLAAQAVLISKGTTGEYHLIINTDGSLQWLQGPAYSVVVAPAGTITAGSSWFHVVVSRTLVDKSIKCYVNGVLKSTNTYTTTPTATSNAVAVGANLSGGQPFNGTLDEVAVYARPLLSGQAANHYAWGTPAPLNPNSDFESNVNGWTAIGATVTWSSAWAQSGTHSALITPDGVSPTAFIEDTAVAVAPNVTYIAQGWMWASAGTGSKPCGVRVNWYAADGSYISTSVGSDEGPLLSGVARPFSNLFTSPLAAAKAGVHAAIGATPAATTTANADLVRLDTPTCNPWGAGRYGYRMYPRPGQATGAMWGTAVWGSFTWA